MKNRQVPMRLFGLIRMLNTPPAKSAKQLISSLAYTNKSTFYEDKKLLEELGYPIVKDRRHRMSLDTFSLGGSPEKLTKEEKDFLQEILQRHAASNPHAEMLLHKFQINPKLIPVADALPQLHASRIIRLVRAGIEYNKCLRLKAYRSLTSNKVSDRNIEPLELTLDFRYLIAWDLDKDGQRQFKINRIGDVDFLEQDISGDHIASPMDMFGLTGEEWLPIRMKLSDMAYHLLVEEFPLSRQFVRPVKQGGALFDGVVRHYKGVGRFVLSLPGEVKVVESGAFKKYLKERRKNEKF